MAPALSLLLMFLTAAEQPHVRLANLFLPLPVLRERAGERVFSGPLSPPWERDRVRGERASQLANLRTSTLTSPPHPSPLPQGEREQDPHPNPLPEYRERGQGPHAVAPPTPDAGKRPPDVTVPPAADQFIIIPLRVHVLSGDPEEIDCKLTDADVERIVGKVNRVWSVAGIHFGVGSIVREQAARQGVFTKWKEEFGGSVPLHFHRALLPDASRKFEGLHVYYVHKLPVNGVYMGDDFALVQETAKLREVPGGIDEPLPRVTSHELGHALGLPHRQHETNLMASGTTGTLLNEAEVKVAREKAMKVKGAMTLAQCREAAKQSSACDAAKSERLSRWVTDVESIAKR